MTLLFLLKPGPFNPTPYRPKFRYERVPLEGDADDIEDDEILVTIIAMADR